MPNAAAGGLFDAPAGVNALAQLGTDAYAATENPPVDIFGSPPLGLGIFGSSPTGTASQPPAADPFADFFSSISSSSAPVCSCDAAGSDAIRFLADRGGVSFMARTPEDVARGLRQDLGVDTFRRIEFLFSNDQVSRARMVHLRERVAERAGHKYPNLKEAQAVVLEVLSEEGIDFGAPESSPSRDVLENVLLIQLLPDDVPLFRSTEHVGQAGEGGSSWWGVGSDGLGPVAASYAGPGRHVVPSTLGQLRQSGVIRVDEMAVTGNALELYHFPDGDGYVPYQHNPVMDFRLEFSTEGLSTERNRQLETVLAGRDPKTLGFGDQKDLVYALARDHGWSTADLENVFGNQLLLNIGYGSPVSLDLPGFE